MQRGPWEQPGNPARQARYGTLTSQDRTLIHKNLLDRRESLQNVMHKVMQHFDDQPKALLYPSLSEDLFSDLCWAFDEEVDRRRAIKHLAGFCLLMGIGIIAFGSVSGFVLIGLAALCMLVRLAATLQHKTVSRVLNEHAGVVMIAGSNNLVHYRTIDDRVVVTPYTDITRLIRSNDAAGTHLELHVNGIDEPVTFGPAERADAESFLETIREHGVRV